MVFVNDVFIYSLAGDYGFDPLGLGEDPESLRWYVQAELVHARFAMLGVAGILLTDVSDSEPFLFSPRFFVFCFFSFPVNYLSRYSLDPSYWLYINELGSGLSCFKVSPRKSHSFCDYQVFTDLIQLLLGGPILCSKT